MRLGQFGIIVGNANAYPRAKALHGRATLAGVTDRFCVLHQSQDTIEYVYKDTFLVQGGNAVSNMVHDVGYAFYYDGSATYFVYVKSPQDVTQMKTTGSGIWSTSTIASVSDPYAPYIMDSIGDGKAVYTRRSGATAFSTLEIGSYSISLSSGDYPTSGYIDTDGTYHFAVVNGTDVVLKVIDMSTGTVTDEGTLTLSSSSDADPRYSKRFKTFVLIVPITGGTAHVINTYGDQAVDCSVNKTLFYDREGEWLVVGTYIYNLNGIGRPILEATDWSHSSNSGAWQCYPNCFGNYGCGLAFTETQSVNRCVINDFESIAVIEDNYDDRGFWMAKKYMYIGDANGNLIYAGFVTRVYAVDEATIRIESKSKWAIEKETTDGVLHYLSGADVSPVKGKKYGDYIDSYCKQNLKFARYDYANNYLYVDDATGIWGTVDADSGDSVDTPIVKQNSITIGRVILYGSGGISVVKESGAIDGITVEDFYPDVSTVSELETIAENIINKNELVTFTTDIYGKGKIGYGQQVQFRYTAYQNLYDRFGTLAYYYVTDCHYETETDKNTLYMRDQLWYDSPTQSRLKADKGQKAITLLTQQSKSVEGEITQSQLADMLDKNGIVDLQGKTVRITSKLTVPANAMLKNGHIIIEMATSTAIELGYSATLLNCFIEDLTTATSSINAVRMAYSYGKVIGCSFYSKQYGTNLLRFVSVEAAYCVVANNIMIDWAGDYVYMSIMVGSAATRCTVTGNVITNGRYGIGVYGTNNAIVGNSLYSIGYIGIYVDSTTAAYVTITGNQINCGSYAVYINGSSNHVVTGNACNTSIYKGSGTNIKVAHNLGSSYHDI